MTMSLELGTRGFESEASIYFDLLRISFLLLQLSIYVCMSRRPLAAQSKPSGHMLLVDASHRRQTQLETLVYLFNKKYYVRFV